ncbi:hypothetical protein E1301_Tti023198 [Triplophysa tibetana]|uniref:C-type lectin domain-containing protein n=1 Tax=Triplophysa tibetana TaxID=1572043 RepID=A0A5A9PHZ1_9TELE|nr:hypothetical protein E1301_Tti023198 [Triplophysa tibetana]
MSCCFLNYAHGRRYHYININKTWTEAQRYCRENYTDLATVNNINDMNQLKKTVNNNQKVWIGLKRTDELVLIQKNLSWTEAVRYCRENHVDLVSVDSEKIQLWVTAAVHEASTAEVWLGLHYYCLMNLWIWVRGEVVCYQNWAPGVQIQLKDCSGEHRAGAVQSGGDLMWISVPRSHKLNFICTTNKEN